MKEYKGWEIAKMICEGELKEEDLIQNEYGDIFEIKNHHLVYCESDKELGSSYFGGDFNYTILQNPVSFMEAISNEYNKIRVDLTGLNLYSKAKENLNQYMSVKEMFKALYTHFSDYGISLAIKEGKWYIGE